MLNKLSLLSTLVRKMIKMSDSFDSSSSVIKQRASEAVSGLIIIHVCRHSSMATSMVFL